MSIKGYPPQTINDLRQALSESQADLSNRLRDAAHFLMDHPHTIALNTIAVISEKSGIASSTFVRLAKYLGFTGFSDLQQVYKVPLQEASPISFNERIRHLKGEQILSDPNDVAGVLREFSLANIASLEHLAEGNTITTLEHAINLLEAADRVFVIGMRRSFPIASYLSYALNRIGGSAIHLNGEGGSLSEQLRAIHPQDLLVAISFPPYSDDTIQACQSARMRGIRVLTVTDSVLSPIVDDVHDLLEISDAELLGFRSLTASLCVTQALAMGLAFRRQLRSGEMLDREFFEQIEC